MDTLGSLETTIEAIGWPGSFVRSHRSVNRSSIFVQSNLLTFDSSNSHENSFSNGDNKQHGNGQFPRASVNVLNDVVHFCAGL